MALVVVVVDVVVVVVVVGAPVPEFVPGPLLLAIIARVRCNASASGRE